MKYFLGGISIALGILCCMTLALSAPSPFPRALIHGVSFSYPQAESLGLSWKEAYNAVLNDLGVRNLRLSAYWNTIEPRDDEFDFTALDYQMDRAAERGARVILAIGRKLPRWPECHDPLWVRSLSETDVQENILAMLTRVVERYRNHPALRMWQLENEPFLDFGACPPGDIEFLQREQALVRTYDSSHPILITDSGELNSWLAAASFGDLLGTTMYRTVFSHRTQRLFSYDYIFPSWFYRLKSRYVGMLFGKDVVISELQGEPWGHSPFASMSVEERLVIFPPERLITIHRFAERTQLPEAYWWGVEFWYWEKVVQNRSAYWDYAKRMFSRNPQGML